MATKNEAATSTDTELSQVSNEPNCYDRFTSRQKAVAVLIVALAGCVAPLASTIYYPAVGVIGKDLHTSQTIVNLAVTTFMVAMAVAPLFWGPFSDIYGRKPAYFLSFLTYIGGSLGCTFSDSIALLLAMRFLQATGASSVFAVGAGTIGDLYPPNQRGRAIGVFFLGPLIGPILGPMIGGVVAEYLNWHWIFGFLTIFGAVMLLVIVVALPETLPQELGEHPTQETLVAVEPDEKHADHLKEYWVVVKSHLVFRSLRPSASRGNLNPFILFRLLRLARVALVVTYLSAAFGLFYGFQTALASALMATYKVSESQVGYIYISMGVGLMIGSISGGIVTDWWFHRSCSAAEIKDTSGEHAVLRLQACFPVSFLMPLTYIASGLCINYAAPLPYLLVCLAIAGWSTSFAVNGMTAYFVDSFPGKSAAVIALAGCLRLLFAGATSSFVGPLVEATTFLWTFVILGLFTFITTICPVIVYYRFREPKDVLV